MATSVASRHTTGMSCGGTKRFHLMARLEAHQKFAT